MAKSHLNNEVKFPWIRRLFITTVILSCTVCSPRASVLYASSGSKSGPPDVSPPRRRFQNADDAVNRNPFGVLMNLAADEISTGNTFLGRTRFDTNEREGTFVFDLSPAARRVVLSEADPYAIALEALIRVESLERDFQRAVPNDRFWVEPLNAVEGVVKQCIRKVDSPNNDADSMKTQESCSKDIEEQFQSLSMSVQAYAQKHKLVQVRASEERDPAMGYRVEVKIDPPRARVKIMTALEYKKCLALKTPLDTQWNDLLDGNNEMIGRYHYLAEWPAELNGTEEGNFDIRKPTTLTFRPRQK